VRQKISGGPSGAVCVVCDGSQVRLGDVPELLVRICGVMITKNPFSQATEGRTKTGFCLDAFFIRAIFLRLDASLAFFEMQYPMC
jgi:hypothetical protein